MPRDIVNPDIQPTYGPHRDSGLRIEKARKSMHLTLRDFAGIIGTSMTQASMFEQGRLMPSVLDLLPFIEYAAKEVVAGRAIIREMDKPTQEASAPPSSS